jgi:signal transduction histidine kinase
LRRRAELLYRQLRTHGWQQFLLTLLSDILDLSKLEAGTMDLHLERFGIALLVQEVVPWFIPCLP